MYDFSLAVVLKASFGLLHFPFPLHHLHRRSRRERTLMANAWEILESSVFPEEHGSSFNSNFLTFLFENSTKHNKKCFKYFYRTNTDNKTIYTFRQRKPTNSLCSQLKKKKKSASVGGRGRRSFTAPELEWKSQLWSRSVVDQKDCCTEKWKKDRRSMSSDRTQKPQQIECPAGGESTIVRDMDVLWSRIRTRQTSRPAWLSEFRGQVYTPLVI